MANKLDTCGTKHRGVVWTLMWAVCAICAEDVTHNETIQNLKNMSTIAMNHTPLRNFTMVEI